MKKNNNFPFDRVALRYSKQLARTQEEHLLLSTLLFNRLKPRYRRLVALCKFKLDIS